jgi:anti-anti-sigma factor
MSQRFYHVHNHGDLHVIELTLPIVVDPVEFDRLNEATGSLAERAAAERWVLDLSRVEYVGSALLGLLVNLRQRIKTGGGRLVICGLSQHVDKALKTCSLHSLFTVVTGRADAEKTVRAMR